MIYIIKEKTSNFCKIGYSKNVKIRLRKMQSDNPRELILLKTYEGDLNIEKRIHNKYKELHIRGDWFKFDNEMLNIDLNNLPNNKESIKVNTKLLKAELKINNLINNNNINFIKKEDLDIPNHYYNKLKNIIHNYNIKHFGTTRYNTFKRICKINELSKEGHKDYMIAKILGVSTGTISNIKNNIIPKYPFFSNN